MSSDRLSAAEKWMLWTTMIIGKHSGRPKLLDLPTMMKWGPCLMADGRAKRATMLSLLVLFFSSRRRHTRLQGDWSSDVCSSDLGGPFADPQGLLQRAAVDGVDRKRLQGGDARGEAVDVSRDGRHRNLRATAGQGSPHRR